jgi:hypothetical protein
LLLVWFAAALTAATPLGDTARLLARKIAVALPGQAVAVSFRNLSSLSEAEAADVRTALESELRASGISFAPNAAVKVAVTLSENQQDLVFAAEITRGEKRDVALVTRPRTAASPALAPDIHAVIEKKLLWEQADPILDAALVEGDLLLLEPARIWFYYRRNDHWEPGRPIPIPQVEALPRDLRGRLEIQGDSFRAFLPGTACFGSTRPEFSADCGESDAKWPVGTVSASLVAGRNLFTGRAGPFYSVAEAAPFWIFTAVDGHARLYDQAFALAGSFDGWGSDIVAVRSNCGNRRLLVVTRASDADETDAVQAFEVTERRAIAVSAAVEFLGPITALWPTADESAALAVSRNLRTGQYAAFRLSINCGN